MHNHFKANIGRMTCLLWIMVAMGFLSVAAVKIPEDRFFKGTKAEFTQFLLKLYKQIDTDIPGKVKEQLKIHTDMLNILREVKKLDPCFAFNLELKGSNIEDVKIGLPDEFDFALVNPKWTGKIVLLENQNTPPGFGYAVQEVNTCLNKYLVPQKNFIDPAKVRGRLRELVEQAVTTLGMDGRIKGLREGGPAVTFEVITQNNKENPEISIDLAIAIDLKEWPKDARKFPSSVLTANAQLVPKLLSDPHTNVWQISFSKVEKKIMQGMDEGDRGCRKRVLQLAKHLKSRAISQGFFLASYHLKMTLFYLDKEKNKPGDWAHDKLADRFMDLINKLLFYLEETKKLPSFFIEGYNIFGGKPDLPSAAKSIHQAIEMLYSNPNSFLPENNKPQTRQEIYHKESKKKYYVLDI